MRFIFILKLVGVLVREFLEFVAISKVIYLIDLENQYVQGEDCIAICEVDNSKCKVPMKEIKVKLKKAITLTSQFGEEETIIKEINKAAFPGVPAFQHYGGQFTQKLSLPLKDKHSKTPLQPSTNGRLVKCHYFL